MSKNIFFNWIEYIIILELTADICIGLDNAAWIQCHGYNPLDT